ncbi:hypothetical protein C7212DRAFT_365832 [Tuber magnatum]|uniref:Uncharacterized protein n=1 Tax=Tuber magnatum TaxID=42249 RepID=A0A317SK16_9PEZI|nr:hypothetical protein C7212DRAFT_365832 [Tuber magnatum]
MANNPAQQVDVSATPSTSQTLVPDTLLDIAYYLKEGLEGVECQQYCNAHSFTRAIKLQAEKLQEGNLGAGQYAVFSPVTQDQLTNLQRIRDARYKTLRFLYLNDVATLIVKIMSSQIHQVATHELVHHLRSKIDAMGLFSGLRSTGTATFQGLQSQKEADASFKPSSRPGDAGWPTVILECGISESLRRLRIDAEWWLKISAHDVKIVLLISASKQQQKIHLEQWESVTIPNPRITCGNNSPLATVPIRINEIDITVPVLAGPGPAAAVVNGAPLTLDFTKVFLRQPGPGEGNIILTSCNWCNKACFHYEQIVKTFGR